MKKEITNQSRILLILSLFLLVAVTASVSYAYLSVTDESNKENEFTSGSITFVYDDINKEGNTITITNSVPLKDSDGINLTDENNIFDFKILANTTSDNTIDYEVTLKKEKDSTIQEDNIKVYLTQIINQKEVPVDLTIDNNTVKRYSELEDTKLKVNNPKIEKTIYQEKITESNTNYSKDFRLRVFISNDKNYNYTKDDTFKVTINVYSNANKINK